MTEIAFLEVDNGDFLSVNRKDGLASGKALRIFELYLFNFKNNLNTLGEYNLWFSNLEAMAITNIKMVGDYSYDGNWNLYQDGDYERFIKCEISNPFKSENEFNEFMDKFDDMWTPITELIPVIEELVMLLPKMGDETHWYSPNETVIEYQALLDTLELAQKRGGEEVRLKFE